MGFHAENNAEALGLLDTPVQLVHCSLPCIGWRSAIELDAGKRCHMTCPDLSSVLKRADEPITCLLATCCFRVVDGVGREFGIHLQEDIGCGQAMGIKLAFQSLCRRAKLHEFARRPEMRAVLEETDIHARKLEHRNELEHLVMG